MALVGPNGQGKTNLVEAIGYLATLSSHRVPTDAALVRSGADRAVVGARVQRAGRATTVAHGEGRQAAFRAFGRKECRPRGLPCAESEKFFA